MLIDLIAGARPNFVKISAIVNAIKVAKSNGSDLDFRLIHTGQHYDTNMSGSFFDQLGIPAPDVNLEVGSGTQAEQTGSIMLRYETLLTNAPCDICIVVGDVTSTMATSIVARKLGIPVAHVEGGIRSGDWTMPEEINRVVTDSISNWFFTTSQFANENLAKMGVKKDRIFFVGNTMIDTLLSNMERFSPPSIWGGLDLKASEYIVLTMHRPANVDSLEQFATMLRAIVDAANGFPVIFPVHPRTSRILENISDFPKNLKLVDPQPYLEFNYLVKNSMAVITDSGGITEEATIMGVPCLTLRDNTERPETVTIGTNELIGTDPRKLAPAMNKLFTGQWKVGGIPDKWDGNAGKRIVEVLEKMKKDGILGDLGGSSV